MTSLVPRVQVDPKFRCDALFELLFLLRSVHKAKNRVVQVCVVFFVGVFYFLSDASGRRHRSDPTRMLECSEDKIIPWLALEHGMTSKRRR